MSPRRSPSWTVLAFTSLLLLLGQVAAQSNSTTSSSSSSSLSNSSSSTSLPASLSLQTTSETITTTLRSGNTVVPITTVVPVVLTVTIPTTTSASATSSSTASATPTSDPNHLETKLDPAFGVLGAILILTGIPSAFLGHKNRWYAFASRVCDIGAESVLSLHRTSFFLIGFYTLSLVCFVLILRFGVLQAVNPPSKTLRGLFVLSCGVAGIAGGGVAIFFWKATRYFTGGWGGLAFALWIQCFRDGGLIRPIGFRWIMYIGQQSKPCCLAQYACLSPSQLAQSLDLCYVRFPSCTTTSCSSPLRSWEPPHSCSALTALLQPT